MELSPFLNSTDSLMEQKTFTNTFGFESDFDRDIITTSKILNGAITNVKIGTAAIGTANIGTLSFNQISGGTANLGGTTNGNGLLSLKNAAGSEIVKLDNTGMTVTNGSITINNSGGSAIIDSSGLVGTSNFVLGSISGGPGLAHTYTSTSEEDVPSSSISVILARATPVAFWATTAIGFNKTTTINAANVISLSINGTIQNPTMFKRAVYDGSEQDGMEYSTVSTHRVLTLAVGTNTVKLSRRINNTIGTATGTMDEFFLTYLVLGR